MANNPDRVKALDTLQQFLDGEVSFLDAICSLPLDDELLEVIFNEAHEPEWQWASVPPRQFVATAIEAIKYDWNADRFYEAIEALQ